MLISYNTEDSVLEGNSLLLSTVAPGMYRF